MLSLSRRPADLVSFTVKALIGLMTLAFDLLTSKYVHGLLLGWVSVVTILVFLCLSILELGRRHATGRQTDGQKDGRTDGHKTRPFYNAPYL